MVLRGLVSVAWLLTAATVAARPGAGPAGPEGLTPGPSERRGEPTSGVSADPDAVPAPLPFFYDLYTFRTDGGGTTVVAAVAVPVRRLRWERRDNRVQYRFDVRFVLADTVRRSVFPLLDSVFVSTPQPLPRRHLLHTYVELEAPPSEATVQRVVVTDAARPGVGQLYTTPFRIPDYSGRELMLSDIALGLPGAQSGWTRRGVDLALLPTSQFPESAFDVYYEIYNLPAGTPYETEISIESLDEPDDAPVRAVFSGESDARDDASVAELRRVESALPRGSYRLTVTVKDLTDGREAETSRLVDVRGWARGTTMVPALPRGQRAGAGDGG